MPIEPFEFTYTLTSQASENEVLNALGKTRVKEFEPKSYFFTESNIPEQTSSTGAYGPDGTTKFNITTQFDLTDKKAYAVTSGQVLIVPQTGSTTKVNVFIKPLSHIDIGVPIKYYVYRGLKKASFINTVDIVNYIVAEGSVSNPFMAKVWIDLKGFNPDIGTDVPATLFGYNTTDTTDTRLDAKFFNVVEDTTTEDHKIYNLPIIAAGQHFGEFADNTGGFEIVLNDGFYHQEKSDTGFEFDMKYAKSAKVTLNTADIVATPDISEKIYRENVQKFLDPAAFYGAHITEKGKGQITVVDNSAKHSSKEDIYNKIVSKFHNKNKCYLYIQCNRGRSFNFDEVLGTEPLKIGVADTVSSRLYQTDGWPIIIDEFEQTHDDGEADVKKEVNNLSFELKFKTVDKKAYLYNTYGNCVNSTLQGNFLSWEALIVEANIATQSYTNTINYKLINNYGLLSSTSLITQSIASFIYINHEEKEIDYFNDFFGPINIEPIIKVNDGISNSVIKKASNKKLKLKSKDGILSVYNQELIIKGKVTASIPPTLSDDNRTRLYVLKRLDSTNNNEAKSNEFMVSSDGYSFANTKEDYNAYTNGDKNYSVWKGTIGHGTGAINTLQLINFEQDSTTVDFMQLGLTEANFNNLIYNSDEIVENSTHLPADATNLFFHLDDTGIIQDPVYEKYKLGVKYLSNDVLTLTFPTTVIDVYTIDGCYFFTKGYSEKFEFAEEFGNSTINFRPMNDYQGEFGFDWLRVSSDSELSYESIIESGYKKPEGITDTTKFTKEEAFQALKKEYINIKTQIEQEIYYVPFLNIYPPSPIGEPTALSTVKLKGIPLIDENSINIRFDCDTSLLSVSSNLTVIDQFTSNIEITVTCLKEFDKDQIIKTIGISTDVAGNIQENVIGLIKVCKNSKANMSDVKVVLVQVLTDITNSGNLDIDLDYPDFIGENEIKKLKDTLFQSFVNVENLEPSKFILDMSEVPEFQKDGTYYKKQKEKIDNVEVDVEYIYNLDESGIVPGMQDVLIAKLNSDAPQFTDYIKVFVFAVNGLNPANKPIMGRANGIGSKACAIYKRRVVPVLAHELLHTIGLCHTHMDENGLIDNPHQKYVYPKFNADPDSPPLHITDTTDNIMSYNFSKMKSTWKWQWKILKSILNKTI